MSTDALGGVLSTNGKLVFNGTASGKLIVYHAETGKKLKEIEVGTGIIAAPMSYEIDGEQYVAVMAGFGGGAMPFPDTGSALMKYENVGRIIAFKLNGVTTPMPPLHVRDTIVPEPPSLQ
jgi:quinohemoprotein ethanol dehydrogenase